MKGIIFFTLLVAFVYSAPPPPQDQIHIPPPPQDQIHIPPPPQDQIHIPEKCEDVLAVKVCNQLTSLATNLKLKAEDVKAAVIDAVKQGKTTSKEIFDTAKDFLVQKVLSKKCEDFTTPDNCNKLRALAATLKIRADKVEKFIVEALTNGATTAAEIYARVLEYYRNEIKTKTCEDFLSKGQCDSIRKIANKLKIKTDEFEKAFLDALVNAKAKGSDLIKETVAMLKDLAMNTVCEDVLNPNLCKALRRYANYTKVGFPILMDTAINLIIKGYDVSEKLVTAVFDIVDHFYDCTDICTPSSCESLKKLASLIGVKAVEFEKLLRQFVRKGIELGQDIYDFLYDFLTKKLYCKINIFDPSCPKDDAMSERSMEKRSLADGKQKIIDLLNNKMRSGKFKNYVKALVAKAKSEAEIAKTLIKDLWKGKELGEEIKKFIKELVSGN